LIRVYAVEASRNSISPTVEISLLSPTAAMDVRDEADALAQMRPNVDGIVFEFGRYRSTFLPQVWEDLAQPAPVSRDAQTQGRAAR